MFKLYSGLDYLKIDIANNLGKDKLLFEERIRWFDENIPDSVVVMDNKELKDFVLSFTNPDSIELAYTGLLAYQDYWYGRPSGYRVSLDGVCSGASIMSALTCDINGLNHTGLNEERRGDLYTAVYNTFKKICDVPLAVEAKRDHIKDLVMQMLYGSKSVIEKTAKYLLQSDNEDQTFDLVKQYLIEAITMECKGAYDLQQLLVQTWDSKVTKHSWVMPDNFNVVLPNKVEKWYKHHFKQGNEEYTIDFSIKEEGTRLSSVSNCANYIHSIDSLIVREMVRRCMCNFDLNQVIYYLNQVPDNVYEPIKDTSKLTELEELVILYEMSGFVSIRVCEYIHSLQDACKLPKDFINKLLPILCKMYQQGYIEMLVVHDCFTSLSNNFNYIRYWYKEIMANIAESNLLVFLYNQITSNQIKDPISKQTRLETANLIRSSNYGLC